MDRKTVSFVVEGIGPDRYDCEQSLACAVLTRAIRDYLGDTYPLSSKLWGRTQGAIVRGARLWIESDSLEPYAFEWVCETLAIDADDIRAKIKELEKLPEKALSVMSQNLQGFRADVDGRPMRTRTDYLLAVRAKRKENKT